MSTRVQLLARTRRKLFHCTAARAISVHKSWGVVGIMICKDAQRAKLDSTSLHEETAVAAHYISGKVTQSFVLTSRPAQ